MSTRGTDRAASAEGTTTATGPRARRGWLVTLLVVLGLAGLLLLGVSLGFAVAGDDEPDLVALGVQALAGMLGLFLALALGLLEVQRSVHPGADGTRAGSTRFRVWAGIAAVLAVVSAVAGVVLGLPLWLPVLLLLATLGVGATSWMIGRRTLLDAHAREVAARASGAEADADPVWSPADVRRKVLIIVGVFLATAVVLTAILLAFPDEFDGEDGSLWTLVVQCSLTAAGLAGMIITIRMQMTVVPLTRALSGADRKRIGRRVMGKGGPLDPEAEWRAARVAAITRVSQPFLLASLGLVIASSFVSLIRTAAEGPFLVFTLVMGASFVVLIPFAVVEQRKRARYARSSAELARSARPRTEQVEG